MRALVWLAVNGLRWLVVVAVLAWASPWLGPHAVGIALPAAAVQVRTIQLARCSPRSVTLGRWGAAYVCGRS